VNQVEADERAKSVRYRRIVESIDQLPALPAIVTRLLEVVNSPDSSAEDASHLIERDPALTSKMLRLANSAFYGMPRSVSSVNSAVVILGFNAIKSLVLSATLVRVLSGGRGSGFDQNRFWLHSIITAMASRTIIRFLMRVRLMDPESAFCSGIMHDIGKLIFSLCVPADYAQVCAWAKANKKPLCEAETHLMGINHTEIGRIVADRWALPLDLEYSIVYHHQPQNADKINELVAAVHVADTIAHEMNATSLAEETAPALWQGALSLLQLDLSDYEKVRVSLKDELEKSRDFFTIITQ
jgi:HD-like signal output (HDOD) protein